MPEQVKLLIMNIKSCEGFKVSVQLPIPFVGLALVAFVLSPTEDVEVIISFHSYPDFIPYLDNFCKAAIQ